MRTGSIFNDEPDREPFRDQTIRPSAFTIPSRPSPHSRESSADQTVHAPSIITSPRAQGAPSRQGLVAAVERPIDHSKTAAYGHHRQTSIVHGIQHSRNGSVSSMSTSPLSPQLIAAAGLAADRSDLQSMGARLDMESSALPSRPGTSLAGPTLGPVGSIPMERSASAADIPLQGMTQRRLERMHSRSRREHAAHQSHSRPHRDDQKTVGEYALHVLFTSVRTMLRRTAPSPGSPH